MFKIRFGQFHTFSGSCHHTYNEREYIREALQKLASAAGLKIAEADFNLKKYLNESTENVPCLNVEVSYEPVDTKEEYQESEEFKRFRASVPLMLPAPLGENYALLDEIQECQKKYRKVIV